MQPNEHVRITVHEFCVTGRRTWSNNFSILWETCLGDCFTRRSCRGISPTEDIPPHHLADYASTAILCVPRINESDIESRQVLWRKLSITVTIHIITHKQGHGGGVRQNISVTHSVINQLTDILTELPSSKREESCLLECDVTRTSYKRTESFGGNLQLYLCVRKLSLVCGGCMTHSSGGTGTVGRTIEGARR